MYIWTTQLVWKIITLHREREIEKQKKNTSEFSDVEYSTQSELCGICYVEQQ